MLCFQNLNTHDLNSVPEKLAWQHFFFFFKNSIRVPGIEKGVALNTAVCSSRDLSTEADNIYYIILYYIILYYIILYYIILYYIILYYIAGFVADIKIAQHSSRVFEDLLHILFKFPLRSFLFIFSFNFLLFFFRTAPNDLVVCFSFIYTTERAEFVQISAKSYISPWPGLQKTLLLSWYTKNKAKEKKETSCIRISGEKEPFLFLFLLLFNNLWSFYFCLFFFLFFIF